MNILEVQNVSKSYAAHKALEDVSLNVPLKSIFGLLGPNGAGKTTLIRIINQIIMPDQGDIRINGEALHQKHIKTIGYLPEERGLYKKMKVGEQLLYLARLRGLSKSEATKRIRLWLEKFELDTWGKKKIEDLSKGMAQKVQFIATVLHEPSLIILDEPFSGFDPVNANLIRDEILRLRDNGATIIFSTHRMESVEELCDHIAMINKSQKILDGSKTDIKNSYRNNTFIVDYKGALHGDGTAFDILETDLVSPEGHQRAVVKSAENQSPNDLVQALLSQVTVWGVREKIPSMNEVFITKVQEEVQL